MKEEINERKKGKIRQKQSKPCPCFENGYGKKVVVLYLYIICEFVFHWFVSQLSMCHILEVIKTLNDTYYGA
jgi:hypothetical protein